MDMYEKITVKYDDFCYFHVLGDSFKYLDLDFLLQNHPELKAYIEANRFELNRSYYQLEEMKKAYEAERYKTGI